MESVNEISLDGFKVVSGDYFTFPARVSDPTLTIWDGSLGFTKQDIVMLNSCENIRVSINIEQKKILVIPANSNDKDGVRWTKKADIIKAKKVSCSRLTTQLYDAWELDINYIYRAKGRLVTSGNKVMLLFDFTEAEKWKRPEAKNVK